MKGHKKDSSYSLWDSVGKRKRRLGRLKFTYLKKMSSCKGPSSGFHENLVHLLWTFRTVSGNTGISGDWGRLFVFVLSGFAIIIYCVFWYETENSWILSRSVGNVVYLVNMQVLTFNRENRAIPKLIFKKSIQNSSKKKITNTYYSKSPCDLIPLLETPLETPILSADHRYLYSLFRKGCGGTELRQMLFKRRDPNKLNYGLQQ